MLITKTSRDTYQFSSDFFRPDGGVSFGDFASARRFASQMSAHRTQPVPASDLYAMQLIDEALRVLAAARELEPMMWPLAELQCEIIRQTQGPEAALPIVEEFTKAYWWQYPAFLALGKVKARHGDVPSAIAALTHASRLDVHETDALNLIARIQLRAKNLPAALGAQRRAVARQPYEPSQYILFSEVLLEMGRTEQAHEAREKARQLEEQGLAAAQA